MQSRLDQLDTKIFGAQASASLAAQLVQVAPSLLGGDGVRHYFIAFMDTAESRGLGGLIASYGELTADQGHLTLTRSGDISQLNEALPKGGGHLTGPADYLARYGAFHPQKLMQDLSYAPDLPTVADVIRQLYPQAGGDPIDGVLALDPYGLAALIHLTGPIEVPGLGRLTAANTASELLQGQYAAFPGQQRVAHNYDQDALKIEFHKLTTGSLPGPRALSDALDTEVRQGRIEFWSFDKADQPVLYRLGLAGAFPAARGHDLLAVTTQNAANNKIDVYLQRSISDAVNYDPTNGAVASKVTITLHNGAPAQGLPSEVIGSYPHSGLPSGTNETWLTLYSPLGLRAATVNGLSQGVSDKAELGVHAYSEYVDIPPESSVTLTFDLAGVTTPGQAYRLTLYNQPMVLPDADTVTVRPTPGWTVTGPATWPERRYRQTDVPVAWGPLKAQFVLIKAQLVRSSLTAADPPDPPDPPDPAGWHTRPIFGLASWPERHSGGHLMRHRAVGLWGGFLLLGATALLGAMLLVSGPAAAVTCPYGPCTQPITVTPTTVRVDDPHGRHPPPPRPSPPPLPPPPPPSTPIAFTGAELALMFTIGAIAIGVGGMLVLVSRRRRSQPAYERGRR